MLIFLGKAKEQCSGRQIKGEPHCFIKLYPIRKTVFFSRDSPVTSNPRNPNSTWSQRTGSIIKLNSKTSRRSFSLRILKAILISSSGTPSWGVEARVELWDHEVIIGKILLPARNKDWFYLYPADCRSNNVRILIMTRNVKDLRIGKNELENLRREMGPYFFS